MNDGLVIDMFAGGGGASEGIRQALGREVDIAVNHDLKALLMHKVNHPDALHLQEDVFNVKLEEYTRGRHVSLMWASPDCFTAGHLVWTSEGYKPIEDVRPMDYVLTHKGRMRMVTRFIKKSAYDLCQVKISGCEEQTVTPEHPYYARRKVIVDKKTTLLEPEWVEAKDLTQEYRVGIPINTKSEVPEWRGIVKERHNKYGVTSAWHENELGHLMTSDAFWWVVGRYIGDGSLSMDKGTVDICCEKGEEEGCIRQQLLRTEIKFTERDKATTHSFMIFSKELCVFLAQFGIGSACKTITPAILNLPKRLLRSFLDGYIGADGSWDTSLANPVCYMTTVSKGLAYGLQQCLLKAFGVYGCMRKSANRNTIQGRVVNAKDAYQISFRVNHTEKSQYLIEDGMAWINVRNVEKGVTFKNENGGAYHSVYTLSVDEDESFTVGNVAVHNCTHFSRARGGKPRSQHIRMLPWAVYEQARNILPDIIVCENVAEIQTWEDYESFVLSMRSLGYTFDCRELCAADYGAPTIRKRWYAVFRRDGCMTEWPQESNARPGTLNASIMPVWRPVADCIDFTDTGQSIFERKKPLARATMRRIESGIRRYVLSGNPYIVEGNAAFLTQFNNHCIGQSLREPIKTITCGAGHFGLVTAFLVTYYGSESEANSVAEPLRTITCKDRFGLVTCGIGETYQISDIHLRMLKPEELKLAQGFPKSYVIDRYADGTKVTKTEQVRRIGNSVVPLMARKIVEANAA